MAIWTVSNLMEIRVRFLQHIVRIELYFYANAIENAAQQRLFSDCWLESILSA